MHLGFSNILSNSGILLKRVAIAVVMLKWNLRSVLLGPFMHLIEINFVLHVL